MGRGRALCLRLALAAVPLAFLAALELGTRVSWRGAAAGPKDVDLKRMSAALYGRGPMLPPHVRFDASTSGIPGCQGLIRTNALGMRMGAVSPEKAPGTLRVACLGDSVTFGWCVPEECSYPAQLQELLSRSVGPVEVLNMGVPAARSEAGVRLAMNLLPRLAPDVVVIGYGWNDLAFVSRAQVSSDRVTRVRMALRRSTFYRLLVRLSARLRTPSSIVPPPRQTEPEVMQSHVRRMVEECRRMGAEPILADLCFTSGGARDILESVALHQRVGLVAPRELLDAHDARPPTTPWLAGPGRREAPQRTLLLRATDTGADEPPVVVGELPALGGFVADPVSLNDEGRDGDEKAGDGVYSRSVALPPEPAWMSVDYAVLGRTGRRRWGQPAMPGAAAPASFTVFHRVRVGPGLTIEPVRRADEDPHAVFSLPGDPVHLSGAGLAVVADMVAQHVAPILRARLSQ